MEQKWWPALEDYNPGITKEEWKKLFKDEKVFNYRSMCIMRRFLDFGGNATCVELAEKYGRTFASYNLASSQLAKRVIKKTKCKNPPENLFPVLFVGRSVQKNENRKGLYIWKLRDELKAALEETDLTNYILMETNDDWEKLIEQFKVIMHKEPEIVFDDEKYKWETITKCSNMDANSILSYLIETDSNLIDSYARSDGKKLITINNFTNIINNLIDDSSDLNTRLHNFKEAISSLYEEKNRILNDERSASVFLTCNNPDKYTFYKDSYYNSLCKYLKIEPASAGEKYEHYMSLIEEFVSIIESDSEIMSFYNERVQQYKNSIKLIAQNILYVLFEKKRVSYIIANLSWNSSDWKDITNDKTNFRWTQIDGNNPNESWNFDLENKRNSKDKLYGFVQFRDPPKNSDKEHYFIVFRSLDPKGNNKIVGFYGSSEVLKKPKLLSDNNSVNVIAKKKLCILLNNKLDDSNGHYLFGKQRLAQGGYNYISKANSLEIINAAIELNPTQAKELKVLKQWLESTIPAEEEIDMGDENMSKENELAELLKNTHNLILHGAPGTGKTFLAQQIAEEMGCTKNEVGFVQFHPSYDYTDFVEGIRPNNNNGFERKDGIFKEFCKKALQNLQDLDKSESQIQKELTLNEKIMFFIEDSIENQSHLKLKKREDSYIIIDGYHDDIVDILAPNNDIRKNGTIHISKLLKILNADREFDKAIDIERYLNDYHSSEPSYLLSIYKAIKEYSFNPSDLRSEEIEKEVINKKEKKNFIFIIDEINRGELSKIFGEMFFSIDPGYRGIKGLVNTQYQNLIMNNEVFAKGFYIPENVYVIGTMNDIDRSVESMDFAFRRRFTFKEITAKETQESILAGLDKNVRSEAVKRMDALNAAISATDGLSSAYHIGGAYFLKVNDLQNDFKLLWEYHLEPLLQEYLRGQGGVKEKMDKLKAAYDGE